jgi:multidrug efflux system membrane fusion protein
MKRTLGWVFAALVVLAIALALGRAYTARNASAPALAASPVAGQIELAATDVMSIQLMDITQGLRVTGVLKAVNSALVKARVAGELQMLSVREGDTVTAGQVLAQIDPREFQARLQQAQQQADAALAQIDIAQRQFANNKALVDQGFISKTALDTSLANLQAAQATHRAALAFADIVRQSLNDTVLKAPIAGQISQRLAQPGERVGVDARILEIVDLRQIELESNLPSVDASKVKLGQLAQLRVEGAEGRVTARLVRVNPSAQLGTRTFVIYLKIEQPAGQKLALRQGLFAEGLLNASSTRVLAVPLKSVRTDQVLPFVQLVREGKVHHQTVTLGLRGMADSEEMVAVEGLREGDLLIKGATGLLRQGSKVLFTPNTPAPAAATPPASAGAAR